MTHACYNKLCPFRHPTRAPVIDRSKIPCFHLSQPGGCLKGSGCPFNHSLQTSTHINNTKNQIISNADTLAEEHPNATSAKGLQKAIESIKHQEAPTKKSKKPASEVVNPPLKKAKSDKKLQQKKQTKEELKTKQDDTSKPKTKVDFGVKKLNELLPKKRRRRITKNS